MMRNAILTACALLLLSPLLPQVRAADPAPEEVFKANGFTKVGMYYLLEGDIKLPEGLRAVRQAKKQVDEYTRKKTINERELETARASMTQWEREYDDLKVTLAKKHDVYHHNQVVAQINARVANIREAARYIEEHEKEAQKLVDPHNMYVGALMDLADSMENTAKEYEQRVNKPEVIAALKRFNEKALPKMRLGPSANFTQELAVIRKERSLVNTGVVKFQPGQTTALVSVTLNGQLTQTMLVDSGASYVSLSWDTARRLGLSPGPQDESVSLHLADGKVVDAKVMTLQSVRVGQFKVENCLCVVMPQSVKGSELLGGTFLKNFRYEMDLAAGELHMSQLLAKADVGNKPAVKVTAPTSAPSAPPAAAAPAPVEITVAATHAERDPVPTHIRVVRGQTFSIEPNPKDSWAKGGGTHKGRRCDYRGYGDKPGWLAMKWKIGASMGLVEFGTPVIAPEAGDLYLFCNDDKPALNDGAIRANITVKPVPVDESKNAGKAWVVLFRSVYPAHWNTSVKDANSYAVPLDQAPTTMRYLRIRNSAGDYVIIPLTFSDLTEKVTRDKYGWEGRNYQKANAFHLGVFDTTMPRAKTGSIDVTQRPGAGYTGYGFGNRVNRDDEQGYVWAGKPIEKAGVEIAVTSADLTAAERQRLLPD